VSRVPDAHLQFLRHERNRRDCFGEVRPLIHAEWRGEQWIAVGNELFHSPAWKTPIDFLCDYIRHIMTPAWGNAELAKPFAERHPVLQWYDRTCRLQAQQTPGPDGTFSVVPSGYMRAYLLLAFDLYTLQHHQALQKSLVKRLRQLGQFQGARHELFATATCIRAGYTIEYEPDRSKPQAEFVAVHRYTQQRITVEAKSRHLQGVLGMPGQRVPDEKVRLKVRHLMRDALKKPRAHPYVIFLDVNLPPNSPAPPTHEWCEKVLDPILLESDGSEPASDPWNLLVVSNHPNHYVVDDGPAPGGYAVAVLGKNPLIVAQYPDAINAVQEAANKFGNLPGHFEDMA
jgi:hypothetical protein